MVARVAGKARGRPLVHREQVSLDALQDVHVRGQGACLRRRLSEKGNRLMEQGAQKILPDKLVQNGVSKRGGKDQKVAPLATHS